jgi:DNA-binding MarR family transcriptional regulator
MAFLLFSQSVVEALVSPRYYHSPAVPIVKVRLGDYDARMKTQSVALFDLVERLGNLIRASLRAAGSAHGLQPVHIQALMYLAEANRYSNTPQALGEYLGLTKGTVSQSVLLLARKKLVARQADAHDGRVVRLFLTDSGAAFLKQLNVAGTWRDALQAASPARINSAAVVLRQLLGKLQQQSGKRTFGVCATCQHNQRLGPRTYLCGLTRERLSSPEARKICREHAPPAG